MTFVVVIFSNATLINTSVYDFTDEQLAILSSQEADAVTLITKLFILSSVNSGIAIIGTLTGILTIIFIIVLAKTLKEVIPVLPS